MFIAHRLRLCLWLCYTHALSSLVCIVNYWFRLIRWRNPGGTAAGPPCCPICPAFNKLIPWYMVIHPGQRQGQTSRPGPYCR
jgi:hypothetical protein